MISHQDRRLLGAMALFQENRERRGLRPWMLRTCGKLLHHFWTTLSGADISREARLHRSVRMPHPNGIVIHRDAVVEEGCLIMQQVTLGQLAGPGTPVVKRGTYIGAGAKILGPVTIGPDARIGANAVVLQDVPEGATAVGVPARIIKRATGH